MIAGYFKMLRNCREIEVGEGCWIAADLSRAQPVLQSPKVAIDSRPSACGSLCVQGETKDKDAIVGAIDKTAAA